MNKNMRTAMLILLLATGACATTPGDNRLAQQDPLEPMNRAVWGFNQTLDKTLVKPASSVYRTVTPVAARRGATNVLNNVDEPMSFINALLQGKIKQAARTAARFVINTTIGVGGLADHASSMGLKAQDEDFGQTLAVWGVNAGPYIVLPFFGPSTMRDSVGFGVEYFTDPYRLAVRHESGFSSEAKWGLTGFEVIDLRSQLTEAGADKVLDTSADSYATARSAYLQYSAARIRDEELIGTAEEALPDATDFEAISDETSPNSDRANLTPPPE